MRWTEEQDKFLTNNYLIKSYKEISEIIGKSRSAIEHRRVSLGLEKQDTIVWTKEKDKYLEDNYLIKSHKEIANFLGLTANAVKIRCSRIKLRKEKIYNTNETYFDEWSHDMSYILGYVMADGCVRNLPDRGEYSLTVGLSIKDIDAIHFF